ncbi:hypothetical protein NDU88_007635 [Pleurodeles waltl]|uniref:Uncharacterized protein n=1 Tax=Pleurodeles waltl TaxID=8319 RepID=A0AAV7P2R1_PLEWA|nr:hypothetical protein NDU88_007635 [Pleurodeles waltl]
MPALDFLKVAGAEILPRGVSDHAPIRIRLGRADLTRWPVWRLNAWHLQDTEYTQEIRLHLDQYFELNEGSVRSPGMLWAACKATIRGHARSILRSRERDQNSQITELENKARRLECQHKNLASASTMRKLTRVREDIKHIMLDSAKHMWRASAGRIYGWGDKNGKLLHWLATRPMANRIIPEILDDSGTLVKTAVEIAHSFASYYARLYARHPRPAVERESPLLNEITFPGVTPEVRDRLDEAIGLVEVCNAISGLASGKTPGPTAFQRNFIVNAAIFWVPTCSTCTKKQRIKAASQQRLIKPLLW